MGNFTAVATIRTANSQKIFNFLDKFVSQFLFTRDNMRRVLCPSTGYKVVNKNKITYNYPWL